MSTDNINDTDPARLAELLQVSDGDDEIWRPEELREVFRHQLSVPVEFDLGALSRSDARRLSTTASSQGLMLKSFADLLQHANPPLKLLELTKQFAKMHLHHPDSPLPRDIATMLYFASIAAALVRRHHRITELDDQALQDGFAWASRQPWVDEPTRALLERASRLLAEQDEGSRRE